MKRALQDPFYHYLLTSQRDTLVTRASHFRITAREREKMTMTEGLIRRPVARKKAPFPLHEPIPENKGFAFRHRWSIRPRISSSLQRRGCARASIVLTLALVYSILSSDDCRVTRRLIRGAQPLPSGAQPPLSDVRQHSIMIQLSGNKVKTLHLEADPDHLIQNRTNAYWLNNLNLDENKAPEEQLEEGCVPLGDWQDSHHPSCLTFHEIDLNDLSQMNLVNWGGYRDVWMIHEFNGNKRALKTSRYEVLWDRKHADRYRREAVAMEQLTSSPYIADVYGYCSFSSLADFSDRSGGMSKISNKDELLKIAHYISVAVADVHHVSSAYATLSLQATRYSHLISY